MFLHKSLLLNDLNVYWICSIQRSQNDYTYLFIPRNVLLELFGDFGMDLPQNLTFSYDPTSNGTLETGDVLPMEAKDAADSGSFALGGECCSDGSN